jgi:S1-C subfamily serine protease
MKNALKVAFLSSIITAALVYVVLEWKPLRPEASRPPEVSWASSVSPAPPAEAAPVRYSDDERNNIEIYEKYGPGVVNITTTTLAYDFFLQPVPQSGTGSGSIIDTEGRILTNFHVINQAQRLEVTLHDKSKYPAKIVGIDPNHDLAVIKIEAPKEKLKPIPIGTSKGLVVGQKVLAIGNPYGLERTLTIGIISSLGRSIEAPSRRIIDDVIQTDAAINPGNSGGPLLNTAGEIIGVNTAILSESGGSAGIGFAIPADTVKEISQDLITLGYVPHPYLGVRTPINLADYPMIVRGLRLNTDHGLFVTDVSPGSPAQKGGIRPPNDVVIIGNAQVPVGGDIILAINGKDVGNTTNLASIIEKFKPGDRIVVTVLRDGRKIDLPVTLAEQRQ